MMPLWCTCLFCIGWLGNVQRFITRTKPLHDFARLLNPLVLRLFRCRCGLCKISAVVVYKKSRCRLISVLFASVFVILTEKLLKNSKRTIIVFDTGKRLYHLPVEISGNSPRNFWSNGKRPLTRKSIPESGVSR